MFRASDIYGAPAGPRGPALAASGRQTPDAGPIWGGNAGAIGAPVPMPPPASPGKSMPPLPPPSLPKAAGSTAPASWGSCGARGPWQPGEVTPNSARQPWQPGSSGPNQGVSQYGPARVPPPAPVVQPYSPYSPTAAKPVQVPPQKRVVAPKPAGRPVPPPQPTPNTVVLLGAASLPQGIERDIEERTREICIEHGFSICDEVRYVSPSLAFIDFPYHEACRDFLRTTGGTLKVRHRSYKLQHSSAAPAVASTAVNEEPTAADGTPLDHPTDTLMVRQIGDLTDNKLMKAFQNVVPTVKGVRILMDRHTRKSKGFGFVSFWSVSEAETAMSRLIAAGSMIDGRKVSISYAKPQTHEQMLESDMSYRNEQSEIQAQAQQALSGINADMWASYLQFFSDEKEKAAAAKVTEAHPSDGQEMLKLEDKNEGDGLDGRNRHSIQGNSGPTGGSHGSCGGSATTPGGCMGSDGGFGGGGCLSGSMGGQCVEARLAGAAPKASPPSSGGSMCGITGPSSCGPCGGGAPCGAGSGGLGGPPGGMSGMGGMPNLPNLPSMPGLPNLPNMPGMSGNNNSSGVGGNGSMMGPPGGAPGPPSGVGGFGGLGSPSNLMGSNSGIGSPSGPTNMGGGLMGSPSGMQSNGGMGGCLGGIGGGPPAGSGGGSGGVGGPPTNMSGPPSNMGGNPGSSPGTNGAPVGIGSLGGMTGIPPFPPVDFASLAKTM